MDRDSEIQLARRLLSGEPEAFDEFVAHFRAKIFHYSWLMCRDREDAEEVAQEALMKIFENFTQLRDPATVRPWVFRIARNACLMKRRRSVFAPERELSLDELMPAKNREDGGMKIEIADWSALPEDQVLRSELKHVLERAIADLSETYRQVVLLRDVEELSTGEAAQILGLSEDTVKQRLHRGRLALRRQLDEYMRTRAKGGVYATV